MFSYLLLFTQHVLVTPVFIITVSYIKNTINIQIIIQKCTITPHDVTPQHLYSVHLLVYRTSSSKHGHGTKIFSVISDVTNIIFACVKQQFCLTTGPSTIIEKLFSLTHSHNTNFLAN
jgi:hypothetical protein